MEDLGQAVIELHNIARFVEQRIGQGELSASIRESADILSVLIRYNIVN